MKKKAVKSVDGGPFDAILVIGPTGAGKTPLGMMLEERGFHGRRCVHFDFGSALRAAASGSRPPFLDERSFRVIQDVLATGAFLEDAYFPIACRILERFIAERSVSPDDLLVLNGLPRHRGQASNLEGRIRMRGIVWLKAGPGVVRRRIQANTGGDREGRLDDAPDRIRERMRLFRTRTRPLIAYYRKRRIPVCVLRTGVKDTAETLWKRLQRRKRANALRH